MLKRDDDAFEPGFAASDDDEDRVADRLSDRMAESARERLLDLVELTPNADPLDHHQAAPLQIPERISGVVMGRLLAAQPTPVVAWAGAPEGVPARSMVGIDVTHLGREVALMFEEQNSDRPLIMGLIETFSPKPSRRPAPRKPTTGVSLEVSTGKERVTFEAQDELVLRCGKASITLTKSGKIIISGAYVSSSSTGMNRIRGGSVEIN